MLDRPTRFTRRSGRGQQGLCWFRADAHYQIGLAYKLAAILRRYDVLIERIRTNRPGYIAFEDNEQIVAIPYRTTPR